MEILHPRFDDLTAAERKLVSSDPRDPFNTDPRASKLVSLWNDHRGRTHEQVLALLDSAIARQRARMGAGRHRAAAPPPPTRSIVRVR